MVLIEDFNEQLAFRKVDKESENFLELKNSITKDFLHPEDYAKLELLLITEKKGDAGDNDIELFKKKCTAGTLTEEEKTSLADKFGAITLVVVGGNHRVTILKDILSSKTPDYQGYQTLRYRPSNVYFELSNLEIEILGTRSNKNIFVEETEEQLYKWLVSKFKEYNGDWATPILLDSGQKTTGYMYVFHLRLKQFYKLGEPTSGHVYKSLASQHQDVIKKILEYLKTKRGKKSSDQNKLTGINFLANSHYLNEWKIETLEAIIAGEGLTPERNKIIEKFGRYKIRERFEKEIGPEFLKSEEFKDIANDYWVLFSKKFVGLKYIEPLSGRGRAAPMDSKLMALNESFKKDLDFFKLNWKNNVEVEKRIVEKEIEVEEVEKRIVEEGNVVENRNVVEDGNVVENRNVVEDGNVNDKENEADKEDVQKVLSTEEVLKKNNIEFNFGNYKEFFNKNDTCSFDLFFADIPYGNQKEYNFEYNVALDVEDFAKDVIKLNKINSNPNANYVIFGSNTQCVKIKSIVEESVENCKVIEQVWSKTYSLNNVTNQNPNAYMKHENFIVITFGNKPVHNILHNSLYSTFEFQKLVANLSVSIQQSHYYARVLRNHFKKFNLSSKASTTWEINDVTQKFRFNGGILNQFEKPIKLLKRILLSYTNNRSKVLEFCAGSGGLAVACLDVGKREYVGWENNENQYNGSVERLRKYIKFNTGKEKNVQKPDIFEEVENVIVDKINQKEQEDDEEGEEIIDENLNTSESESEEIKKIYTIRDLLEDDEDDDEDWKLHSDEDESEEDEDEEDEELESENGKTTPKMINSEEDELLENETNSNKRPKDNELEKGDTTPKIINSEENELLENETNSNPRTKDNEDEEKFKNQGDSKKRNRDENTEPPNENTEPPKKKGKKQKNK
jgi:hypothetical protein